MLLFIITLYTRVAFWKAVGRGLLNKIHQAKTEATGSEMIRDDKGLRTELLIMHVDNYLTVAIQNMQRNVDS